MGRHHFAETISLNFAALFVLSGVRLRVHFSFLLMTQSLQRIHPGCAACREITRGYSDKRQPERHADNRDGVPGFHSVKLAGQVTHSGIGSGDADYEADSSKLHSVVDDHAQHIRRFRAKSHADSNLVGALRYGVSHYSVDSDSGKYSGDPGKQSEQKHAQAAP